MLNKNFQNCYWFQMDASCSIKSHMALFHYIVHLWTIDWILFLDIHMQICVPLNIDLICGLVLTFLYGNYYQSPTIPTIHNCFRQKSVHPKKYVSMIKKYHNHKLQTNPWRRQEEVHNHHGTPGRQTKQSNQLSLPIKMIAKLEWTQSNAQQDIEQLQNLTIIYIVTINNESTALELTAASLSKKILLIQLLLHTAGQNFKWSKI